MAGARAVAQAMKRVPRIKFPQRHSNPFDSAAGETNELQKIFYRDIDSSDLGRESDSSAIVCCSVGWLLRNYSKASIPVLQNSLRKRR